jgi:hypothetical protein
MHNASAWHVLKRHGRHFPEQWLLLSPCCVAAYIVPLQSTTKYSVEGQNHIDYLLTVQIQIAGLQQLIMTESRQKAMLPGWPGQRHLQCPCLTGIDSLSGPSWATYLVEPSHVKLQPMVASLSSR